MVNKKNWSAIIAAFLLLLAVIALSPCVVAMQQEIVKSDSDSSGGQSQKMPITTSSAAAARYFENGMVHYEMHRWNFALTDWREAIKLDPHFALAHAWISMTTVDPAEEASHRELAKTTMKNASRGEQLVVQWVAGIHENRYVDGITAMNDALSMYPHDKRLNFLFGYWLYKQDQYDIAQNLTQKALKEDPEYATAYNQMGYLYSRRGDYAKALEATGKYLQLLPNEPNPHDSHAEMLRLSGRFEEALEHYRMALKIDPTFYISQKELGETYALMGDGERSRKEYAKAVEEAPSEGLKAEYLQKSAMTYIRAHQYQQADVAFLDAAKQAHSMQQWVWEARAYRIMAMYGVDPGESLRNLEKAEKLLAVRKGSVAQTDLDEEQARIWRVRVERAVSSGDMPAARAALDNLAEMSKSGGSTSIERTYQGAEGTWLVAQKKYTAAIPHLEQDFANPLSMRVLITAYDKAKARAQGKDLQKRLQEWRIPSVEEALVVWSLHSQDGAVVSQK